jgi:hypothetical protein
LLFGEPNICLSELTCISVKFFAIWGMMGKHQWSLKPIAVW